MNGNELLTLIQGDSNALSLAKAGADDQCAKRCREIAPKAIVPTRITELGIISLYEDPGDAEAVLQQIETVAAANPIVARVLKWLQPDAPGVDIGDERVRQMLTLDVAQGGIGLTQERAQPILDAAAQEPIISGRDVAALGLFEPQGV